MTDNHPFVQACEDEFVKQLVDFDVYVPLKRMRELLDKKKSDGNIKYRRSPTKKKLKGEDRVEVFLENGPYGLRAILMNDPNAITVDRVLLVKNTYLRAGENKAYVSFKEKCGVEAKLYRGDEELVKVHRSGVFDIPQNKSLSGFFFPLSELGEGSYSFRFVLSEALRGVYKSFIEV